LVTSSTEEEDGAFLSPISSSFKSFKTGFGRLNISAWSFCCSRKKQKRKEGVAVAELLLFANQKQIKTSLKTVHARSKVPSSEKLTGKKNLGLEPTKKGH
jgi:hypothetical protein